MLIIGRSVMSEYIKSPTWSPRKQAIFNNWEAQAPARSAWRRKASFFHAEDTTYLQFLIPKGLRVLDLGCGMGDTLASLAPSRGVGVDFSPAMIELARANHPELEFVIGDISAKLDRCADRTV